MTMIQLGLDICTRKLPLELAQEETHAARTWGTSMGSQSWEHMLIFNFPKTVS